MRGADIACRVGGEEFAIIAPRATEEIAEVLAQRIRGALSQDYRVADPRFKVDDLTVTVGLAAMDGLETEPAKSLPERILEMADRRLYLGKKTGRNRVVGWTAEAEPPGLPLRGS